MFALLIINGSVKPLTAQSAFKGGAVSLMVGLSKSTLSLPCSPPEQDHIPVMRGQWFIDGSWLPLEEEESDLIEQEHLNHFRGQQIQDTFETDLIVKTVDSKDGERKYLGLNLIFTNTIAS